jgi:Flp pilus assembly pilin Flp
VTAVARVVGSFQKAFALPAKRREVNSVLKLFVALQSYAADAAGALGRREDGQTMAEYGVVLAVITLAVIAAITLLSEHVRNALTSVANILPG